MKAEWLGSIAAILLIECAVWAVWDYERAPIFFAIAIGLGTVLNGCLAYLRFQKKNHLLGGILVILTLALLVLLVMHIFMAEGLAL